MDNNKKKEIYFKRSAEFQQDRNVEKALHFNTVRINGT